MSFDFLDLNTTWFVLIAFLFTGYAILDGFDLGIGILHLFVKGDRERRLMLNAIGPVWDGNEVWLIAAGGALFAAFPSVYATVFSGFYTALVLLLASLILRAISIEFRSKREHPGWRQFWDTGFWLGSVLSSVLLGVALGNVAVGVPLDPRGEFAGNFWTLIRPYPILVGITTVALFAMHGATYALLKTEGELYETIRRWTFWALSYFAVCYVVLTISTVFAAPHMIERFKSHPWLFLIPAINAASIVTFWRKVRRGEARHAFAASCVCIAALLSVFAIGVYPNLVRSYPDPSQSLTILNASSSPNTLAIMLTIAIIGMPIVLAYTLLIHYLFRGKVKLEKSGY